MVLNSKFLPITKAELEARSWKRPEVILLTGDAYVDHPSFGAAIVGRYLESLGVKVGIIAAPDINKVDDFTALGEPEWFFAVTAGNLDSMIMRSTASKKPRSDDAYLPGGEAGLRPSRATISYCNKLRELFDNPQILIGGIEASLRRYAHYDYWDNKVRRSILIDSRADLLVYGMAERPLYDIIEQIRLGKKLKSLKGIPGTAATIDLEERKSLDDQAISLPSYKEVSTNKDKYGRASGIIHSNQNPYSSKTLLQKHGEHYICVYPPASPLNTNELDEIYRLPFTRMPHPSYKKEIPAFTMIRFSVTAMRGCFGGCSFCALTAHQGKKIQNRSEASILEEITRISEEPGFKGIISDVGGPTANMYRMGCKKKEVEKVCKKLSCLFPEICNNLDTDHTPQLSLLRKARKVKNIKKICITSGIRYDIANRSLEYINEVARYHVSGQLKVAPEHSDKNVLKIMRKPKISEFDLFKDRFMKCSKEAGLEQYIVPYFISAHPGSLLKEQVDLTVYLKEKGIRPRQIQEFIPAPMTLASDIYYTGKDPFTTEEISSEKDPLSRKYHKALMQYFKSENRNIVYNAIKRAGREELIGFDKRSLVAPQRNSHFIKTNKINPKIKKHKDRGIRKNDS